MNVYHYVFASECPSDGDQIIYGLEIRSVERIMVERIKEVCAEWPRGFQEDIAADLVKQLGGEITLRAQHQGVEIVTTLGTTSAPDNSESEGDFRKPLTTEQIDELANDECRNAAGGIYATRIYEFARAIEAAHGITMNRAALKTASARPAA
ncbi:hypothetical protein [Variovorax sp.]|uniref:hypothetical protein n=1 Tax=Variovorax sp. TaxID=1871043 RepID=UPI0013808AF6|nr:hypothetical protein [Variovorax sp.]KAF1071998.1 MAG: hypothetical protein GAK39_00909 [Variovorax sp.]